MNWVEIGKDRENLPKDDELVVLAYLDQTNRLKYTIAMGHEGYCYRGKPVLAYYDSGSFIEGTYIAYAGPFPQFNYSSLYDLARKLFDFSEEWGIKLNFILFLGIWFAGFMTGLEFGAKIMDD